MNTAQKVCIAVVVACLVLAGSAWTLSHRIAEWLTGYSWSEMDWNQDGRTSFGEVIDAADIGTNTIEQDGRRCTEYIRYKDGLPVRVDCPS